jgi:hypothetical protein
LEESEARRRYGWSDIDARLEGREEMDTVDSLDVILPADTGAAIHLRTVSKPDKPLNILLNRLGLHVPQTPKQLENAV